MGDKGGSPLVVGLVLLLCAKASSEEREQSPVREMKTFLERCGILPGGIGSQRDGSQKGRHDHDRCIKSG
jgi:hypothetical protein